MLGRRAQQLARRLPLGLRRWAYGLVCRARTAVRSPRVRLARRAYALPEVELASLVPGSVVALPPHLEDCCMPPHREPRDHDDLTPLLRIARWKQPRVVVELGTAQGNGTANLCRQCPSARVYTVNAPADAQTGLVVSFALSADQIGRAYRAAGYGDRVVQILQNTLDLDLGACLECPVIDLAVIDACHDTAYVTNDFGKVRPWMAAGGIVLFHDTHPSMKGHLEGSYLACMLLRRQGFDVQHLAGTWWGIWRNEPGSV